MASWLFSREQDPSALLEAGRNGIPTLLVYGTNDKIGNGLAVKVLLKTKFTKLEVKVLEGVGHAPSFEAPEEVKAAILQFVQNVQA